MFPPPPPSLHENLFWRDVIKVRNLQRKPFDSLSELEKALPDSQKLIPIENKHYHDVKLLGLNRLTPVAYECSGCKKFIVGPPNIKDNEYARDSYKVSCTNCQTNFGTFRTGKIY